MYDFLALVITVSFLWRLLQSGLFINQLMKNQDTAEAVEAKEIVRRNSVTFWEGSYTIDKMKSLGRMKWPKKAVGFSQSFSVRGKFYLIF